MSWSRLGAGAAERIEPANDTCSSTAGPARQGPIGELSFDTVQAAMNEMSNIPARPIELAIEAPFHLGTLEITPAALKMRRGNDAVTLEPRVMQVLVALHRADGHVVSREELLQLCWEGRIVGDDSLNRSVSQLRKALALEERVFVETIPRIGYRLHIDAEALGSVAAPTEAPTRARISRPIKIVASVAILAVCGAGGAVLHFADQPKLWSASGVRPLTQEPGVEMAPAIAPDGLSVAYTAGPGHSEPRDIYLRNVSIGDATPMRITQTPEADEMAPAWSPRGDRLAFLRLLPGGKCAIIIMSPPNGAERVVSECTEPYAGLAWLDASELIVGDRPKNARARRLLAINVTSGRSRVLTAPPDDMLGDASPAVSVSGRWLAFRRTAALGSDAIYLLDTRTGKTRPVTDNGWKAAGFAWASDERTIFFSSNRGGDFGLWAVDTERGSDPRRVTLGMLPLGRLSVDRHNRQIAVETGRMQVNLAQAGSDGGTLSSVTNGEGIDWDPDARADGSIVFASDRGGTNQIWVRKADGRIARLTEMDASYVYAPRWSVGGDRIAFIAVTNGRTDIHAIRPDGSGLTRLTDDGAPKGRAIWSPVSSELFFTAVTGTGWHLKRHNLRSGRSTIVPHSTGIAIVERKGSKLYAQRVGANAILEIEAPSGRVRDLPVRIEVEGLEAWSPRSDGIVHIRGKTPDAALWLTTWQGASRRLAPLQPAPRTPFTVAANGSVVTPRMIGDHRDLMLIDLK